MGVFDFLYGTPLNPAVQPQTSFPRSQDLQARAAYSTGQVPRGTPISSGVNYIANSPKPGGVLGAATNTLGGGGGGGSLPQQPQQPAGPNIPSMEEQLKGQIAGAWDSYINSLNDAGNTFLPQQRAAQENIANSQLTNAQSQINQQKASSLRDIANNTRNAFQAGNIYLGARGAGDSSAANQYAFAVNQEAAKQGSQLNEFVNGQLNNLQATHDQQIQSIASWFAQAQQQLKEQIAQGQLSKQQDINNLSQNILNRAIQEANQVKADSTARYNALVSWAAQNSQNIGQLQSNIAAIPQAMGAINMDAAGNIAQPVGQLGTTKKNLFG